jgi:hypothetical protein
MRGPLAGEVATTLGDAERSRDLGLDHDAVRAVWADFRRGHAGMSWSRPWALYALMRWARAHGFTESAPEQQFAAAVSR